MVASPAAIDVRGAVLTYGERIALDGVSLTVVGGAVVGLLGPNGSGKSTLLSLVAGLRAPEAGEVDLLGHPPFPEARRRVGVVFQERCLDPLMTVGETLRLHGRLFGLGGQFLHTRIEDLLSRFGLAERARDAAGTLSGGMRRRLELARALLPEPDVLLLDEPSTGLDPDAKRTLWEHLHDAHAGGITILMATNDVLEAERECDSVVFLHRGKLVAQGSPNELKAGLRRDAVFLECSDGQALALSESIASWPGVGRVTRSERTLHVTVDDVSSFVPRLFTSGASGIRTIRTEPSTLEDAYFEVAGTPLHDRQESDR